MAILNFLEQVWTLSALVIRVQMVEIKLVLHMSRSQTRSSLTDFSANVFEDLKLFLPADHLTLPKSSLDSIRDPTAVPIDAITL